MKRVLIVDDDAKNREFIRVLCEDFADESGVAMQLFEASDGIEAVQFCETESIDIIFMDIMMPNMDGLEASRRIRQISKESMIIAVSAAEDEIYKNTMLQLGAEDYITKPVTGSLFIKRLEHYLRIQELRNKESSSAVYNPAALNRYTKNIYNFLISFKVQSEDDLVLFWERILVDRAVYTKNDQCSDLVRGIYAIGTAYLKKGFVFNIVIEEDDENHYFTLDRFNLLNTLLNENRIVKAFSKGDFRLEGAYLSFRLPKEEPMPEDAVAASTEQPQSEPAQEVEQEASDLGAERVESTQASEEIRVFEFMDSAHLVDLEEAARRLDSSMLYLQSSAISEEELEEMIEYIRTIADILNIYGEVHIIGDAFESLAEVLSGYREEFRERSKELSELFYSFVRDFETWLDAIFHSGAPNLHFLDDSITTNVHMIKSFLEPAPQDDGGLDDIFDF